MAPRRGARRLRQAALALLCGLATAVGGTPPVSGGLAPAPPPLSRGLTPAPAGSRELVLHRGRQLRTVVSTVAALTAALADPDIGTIELAAGRYVLTEELKIGRPVVLEAAVAGTVVLDAQASAGELRRVLRIETASPTDVVKIARISITGGMLDEDERILSPSGCSDCAGAGVLVVEGVVTIEDCDIYDNRARAGGGVNIYNGAVTLTRCIIHHNAAGMQGGGVHIRAGEVAFDNCIIHSNIADQTVFFPYGGGVHITAGEVAFDNCIIHSNIADYYGGGVYVITGTVAFDNCTIHNNTADSESLISAPYGGGVYIAAGTVAFDNCTIHNNIAGSESSTARRGKGGGAYVQTGNVIFTSCTISSNAVNGEGGGVHIANGAVVMTKCSIHSNRAVAIITGDDTVTASGKEMGGGVYVDGNAMSQLTMTSCDIFSNFCDASGGGLYILSSSALIELKGCTIHSNTARMEGGGIHTSGGLKMAGCTIHSNIVNGQGRKGNDYQYAGGGGLLLYSGKVSMTTTVIRDNVLGVAGLGQGANIKIISASTYYELPTPPGYWLPDSGECIANREPCDRAAPPNDPCFTKCKTESGTRSDEWTPAGCKKFIFVQQCDWQTDDCDAKSRQTAGENINGLPGNPDNCLLGKQVYFLPFEPIDVTFPRPCAAGLLGSADAKFQTSQLCAGACPAGKLCPTEKTTQPLPCKAGHYCPKGSSTALACPGGFYTALTDRTSGNASVADGGCAVCGAGSYCPDGSTVEKPCDEGTYSAEMAGSCTKCADGEYQNATGATGCLVCPAGSYSANVLSCEPCQLGEFCVAGARVGKRCPQGFTTDGRGAAGPDDCGCFAGFYEVRDGGNRSCVECPAGTACDVANTQLEHLPLAPGYWRQGPLSREVSPCFTEAACLGGSNASLQCDNSSTGPYCAVCADEYFGGGDGELCSPCEGSSFFTFLPAIILGGVVLLLLVVLIVRCAQGKIGRDELSSVAEATADAAADFRLVGNDGISDVFTSAYEEKADEAVGAGLAAADRKISRSRASPDAPPSPPPSPPEGPPAPSEPGICARAFARAAGMGVKFRIVLSLYQMLNGIGIVFAIPYPKAYLQALSSIGSVLEFDLPKSMPLACIVPQSRGFLVSLVFRTFVPLVIILLLGVATKLIRLCAGRDHPAAMLCSTGWFFLLFLVYPGCSSAVFSAFICDPLEDGTKMLRVDYDVVCWEGEHVLIALYAVIMGGIYTVGTPLLYAALIYANKEALERIRVAEQIAESIEITQKAQAKHEEWVKSDQEESELERRSSSRQHDEAQEEGNTSRKALPPALRKLTAGYEMRCYWFEIFECARKILLVGIPVFLPPGSSGQLLFGLLVCFISSAMYSKFAPYIDESDDRLSQVCQVSLFFSLASAIALKLEADASTDAIAGALIFMLALPPVLALCFESDFEFEELLEALHVAALFRLPRRIIGATVGRCMVWVFKDSHALAETRRAKRRSKESNQSKV